MMIAQTNCNMQTFTVKIAGVGMTAEEIKKAIWQCTELSTEEISVIED